MKKIKYSKKINMELLKKNIDREENYRKYRDLSNKIKTIANELQLCPICNFNNEERELFFKAYELEYIKCNKCCHVYQDYLPSEEKLLDITLEVSERMSKQLYEDKTKNSYRIEQVVGPKIDYVIEHFPKNYQGKWLDVGCGTGELMKIILSKGWEAEGIDNNKSSIGFAKSNYNINIQYGDVHKTKPEYFSNFDVISIFLLFEHLRKPKLFFKNIATGCKKGALLVIEINNADSFSTVVQRAFPDKIDRHLLPCSHTNMFNYKSINYFFNSFGFEIESEWWFGQDFYELNVLLNSNNVGVKNEISINDLNQFQHHIDKMNFSDRIICIFKKI